MIVKAAILLALSVIAVESIPMLQLTDPGSTDTCSTADWGKCGNLVTECIRNSSGDGLDKKMQRSSCIYKTYEADGCKGCFSLAGRIKAEEDIKEKVQANKCFELMDKYPTAEIQSCDLLKKIKCAEVVAKCAAKCLDSVTACIACAGSSYSTCKSCFKRKSFELTDKTPTAEIQGCNFITRLKCAVVVAKCAAECVEAEVDLPACIACAGSSYSKCKSCFKRKSFELMIQNKTPTAEIQGCSNFLDGLACAGVVAGCAVVCSAAEIDAPACIACAGGSYSTCKDCF